MNRCGENFPHIGMINFRFGGTEKSCNSFESESSTQLRRQINSFSLEENSIFGPVPASSGAGQSLLVQYWMVCKGQTSSKTLCKSSNCGDERPLKCFIRPGSRKHSRKIAYLLFREAEVLSCMFRSSISWSRPSRTIHIWNVSFDNLDHKPAFLSELHIRVKQNRSPGQQNIHRLYILIPVTRKIHSHTSRWLTSLFFSTGSALDFEAFLFGARARLACDGDSLAFSGSGNSAVGPFSPRQRRAQLYVFLFLR